MLTWSQGREPLSPWALATPVKAGAQRLLLIGHWAVLYHFCTESNVRRRLGGQGPCTVQFHVPKDAWSSISHSRR